VINNNNLPEKATPITQQVYISVELRVTVGNELSCSSARLSHKCNCVECNYTFQLYFT